MHSTNATIVIGYVLACVLKRMLPCIPHMLLWLSTCYLTLSTCFYVKHTCPYVLNTRYHAEYASSRGYTLCKVRMLPGVTHMAQPPPPPPTAFLHILLYMQNTHVTIFTTMLTCLSHMLPGIIHILCTMATKFTR